MCGKSMTAAFRAALPVGNLCPRGKNMLRRRKLKYSNRNEKVQLKQSANLKCKTIRGTIRGRLQMTLFARYQVQDYRKQIY